MSPLENIPAGIQFQFTGVELTGSLTRDVIAVSSSHQRSLSLSCVTPQHTRGGGKIIIIIPTTIIMILIYICPSVYNEERTFHFISTYGHLFPTGIPIFLKIEHFLGNKIARLLVDDFPRVPHQGERIIGTVSGKSSTVQRNHYVIYVNLPYVILFLCYVYFDHLLLSFFTLSATTRLRVALVVCACIDPRTLQPHLGSLVPLVKRRTII